MCATTPRAEREFPLDDASAARARDFLRQVGCVEHAGLVVEDAVLLVSELVTNSVRYGGPPVVVAVDCDEKALQVRVRDGGSHLPQPVDAEPSAERGRGLALVEMLSSDWGVQPVDDGKHVWFLLR